MCLFYMYLYESHDFTLLQVFFNVSEFIISGVHFTIVYMLKVLVDLFASKANIKAIECFIIDALKNLLRPYIFR